MKGLEEISAPPPHATAAQLAELQASTPESFTSIPPALHLHLAQTTIYLSPSPSVRPTCFEPLVGNSRSSNNAEEDEEEEPDVIQATGELWLTEREVAFLATKPNAGFKLGYPNVALHAVTRSPPSFLTTGSSDEASSSASNSNFNGCLYCQLDLSPNAGTAEMGVEDDEEGEFVEMYICTPDTVSLDRLFEALSHCASLHPSGPEEDDGAHPFAGFAPFGTSASGMQLGEVDDDDDDEAFQDAELDGDHANGDGEQDQELSETGRVRADFQTPDSRYRPY